jgi:Flp pilus assembly protein TadD
VDLKQSQFQNAERQFRAILEHCSADAVAHDGLAIALAGEGDETAAEAEFRSALALDSQNFTALYHLGEIAIAEDRPGDAIDLFSAAARVNPGDIDTRERLAMAFAQSGRPADALRQLRDAERLAPGNADLHGLLSQVLAETGDLQAAIEEQNVALRLHPQDPDGWNNLGVLEARDGKTEAARADFQHALQLAPDNAQALANLAQLPPH